MPALGSATSSSSEAEGGESQGVDRVAMTCVFDHVICFLVAQVPFLVVVGFNACSYSSSTIGWTLLANFRTHLWSLVLRIGPASSKSTSNSLVWADRVRPLDSIVP